ncbi:MAG TPA: hypothetical protein VMB34_05815 [Acetobacteraceae bacterium]|nr:hypothetical protein [Acetobacteraceae bacterium]
MNATVRTLGDDAPRAGAVPRLWFAGARDSACIADLIMGVAFVGLMAIGIAHHQMWRDETNAWGIVLASPTLPTLFHHLHYEGHPGLWHLLLWCAARVTSDPAAIKVVQGIIAAAFIALIAFRSPFSRLEKVLLLLNYYAVFEYAVISRNYGIGLLLALIYVDLRLRRPDRLITAALVLGLLANTNIYATILSCALACELALDRLVTRRGSVLQTVRELAPGAAVFIGCLVVCAATIMPAPDLSWRTTHRPFEHALDCVQLTKVLIGYLGIGVVPAFAALPAPTSISMALSDLALVALLWCALIRTFRRDWRSLATLGLTAIGATTFGQLIYPGSPRHWGIVFVAFVVALWMQRYRRPGHALTTVTVLWLGAVAGGIFWVFAALHPFSNASAAATWLEDHNMRDAAIIGSPDTSTAGVAELLGRPIYFLDCSCVDTFLWFQKRRDDYRAEQFPTRLVAAVAWAGTRPTVLVDDHPVTGQQRDALSAHGIHLERLADFTGAIEAGEDFYLYRVAHQP